LTPLPGPNHHPVRPTALNRPETWKRLYLPSNQLDAEAMPETALYASELTCTFLRELVRLDMANKKQTAKRKMSEKQLNQTQAALIKTGDYVGLYRLTKSWQENIEPSQVVIPAKILLLNKDWEYHGNVGGSPLWTSK
jgi:hypothetical protein